MNAITFVANRLIWILTPFAIPLLPGSVLADSQRPNILLIMADDLGIEGLGCYGGTSYPTPHLDRLAAGGIRFTHAYAQPLCTSTRVQLMTGRYNHRNWVAFGILDPTERTMGHWLRDAGYRTCIAGKWQLQSYDPPDFPHAGQRRGIGMKVSDSGFDEYSLFHCWHTEAKGSRYANPTVFQNGQFLDSTAGRYGPDISVEFILDFMRRHRDEPTFVYYPMALPHGPLVPTPDSAAWQEPSRRLEENIDCFPDMVAYLDHAVGRLISGLESLGLRDNTLVLFYSDNGTDRRIVSNLRGHPVSGGKGSTRQPGIRVPLIANWPGSIDSGQVSSDLIDASDFLPTITELCGVRVPRDRPLDGVSFAPRLRGEAGPKREWCFFWFDPRPGWDKQRYRRRVFALNHNYKLFSDGDLFEIAGETFREVQLNPGKLPSAAEAARDELQQVIASTMKPPRSDAAMQVVDAHGERTLDDYGGWREIRGSATGYFHMETVDGRTLLFTPDGHAFLALGVNHLGAVKSNGDNEPDLFRTRYDNSLPRLVQDISRNLDEWGFNTVDDSIPELSARRPYFAARNLVRTAKYYGKPGGRNSYEFPDVFDDAVQQQLQREVQAFCQQHRSNRNLIGYYWTDTPTWDLHKTRQFRQTDWVSEIRRLPPQAAGKRHYVRFLCRRYEGDIGRFNRAYGLQVRSFDELPRAKWTGVDLQRYEVERDDQAFLGVIAQQYYGIVGPAMRQSDPHHLVFGEKYLLGDLPPQVLRAAAPYINAIAIQPGDGYLPIYTPGDLFPTEEIASLHRATKKPILICDHQISFATTRYPRAIWPYHQRGSEAEAAIATEQFMKSAFAQPYIVGYLRCQYIDRFSTRRNAVKLGLLRDDGTAHDKLVAASQRGNLAAKRLVREAVSGATRSGTISCPPFELDYRVEGRGTPTIIIGFPQYYARAFSANLRNHLRMVFVDHRGSAPSPGPLDKSEFDLTKLVDDVERVRETLGLGRVVVMGHSGHAYLALEYAKKYPAHVSHVVMIGIAPDLSASSQAAALKNWHASASRGRKLALERLRLRTPDEHLSRLPAAERVIQTYLRDAPKLWYDPQFDASPLWEGVEINSDMFGYVWGELFRDIDLRRGLASFEVPVFVALGRYDFAVAPPCSWQPIGQHFHDLTIHVFEKSGHTPQYEEPRQFDQMLLEWLRSREVRREG